MEPVSLPRHFRVTSGLVERASQIRLPGLVSIKNPHPLRDAGVKNQNKCVLIAILKQRSSAAY
jgi:hypothetical protein